MSKNLKALISRITYAIKHMKERWLLGINKRIGTNEWLLVCAVEKLKQNTEKFRDLLFLQFPAFYSEYSLVWVSLPLSSKTGFTVLIVLFSFWCFIVGICLAIGSHMHALSAFISVPTCKISVTICHLPPKDSFSFFWKGYFYVWGFLSVALGLSL